MISFESISQVYPHPSKKNEDVLLSGTRSIFVPDGDGMWARFVEDDWEAPHVDFEYVLDSVPAGVQKRLLFHLDLFS